ncbi:hypothetical protein M569_05120 [Genlisea aurea]|uniref:Reticulon-like protein n=1 Tax=Genlisea aurea TaxID=192259 RepID=S8CXC2_9LAMI|nr:hypothetical protein M569_05120 [Genlisea aurea]
MAVRFSDSDHNHLHQALGGGPVADVILWRNKNLSAAVLMGFTLIWFLFEVLDYNFVTLVCHISITLMLILFLWSTGADFVNWNPQPLVIPEATFRWLSKETNRILLKLYRISSGNDPKTFFKALALLWLVSGIGNYFSFLNLFFACFVCTMIVPAVYEQYQSDVDYLARKGSRDMRNLYSKIDSKFLGMIPRGQMREEKN